MNIETVFYILQHRKAAISKDALVKIIVQNGQLFLERCIQLPVDYRLALRKEKKWMKRNI